MEGTFTSLLTSSKVNIKISYRSSDCHNRIPQSDHQFAKVVVNRLAIEVQLSIEAIIDYRRLIGDLRF